MNQIGIGVIGAIGIFIGSMAEHYLGIENKIRTFIVPSLILIPLFFVAFLFEGNNDVSGVIGCLLTSIIISPFLVGLSLWVHFAISGNRQDKYFSGLWAECKVVLSELMNALKSPKVKRDKYFHDIYDELQNQWHELLKIARNR